MERVFVSILLLFLMVACGEAVMEKFEIVNSDECRATGLCTLEARVSLDGETINPAEHADDTKVTIQWDDESKFSGTVAECVDEGMCRIENRSLYLDHHYEKAGKYSVSLTISSDNIKKDITSEKYLFVEGDEQKDETVFTTFNTGLVKNVIDYYEQRKPLIVDALHKLDSDVVCLNEVWKPEDVEFITSSLAHRYPHSYAKTDDKNLLKYYKGRNGLLILSRFPIVETDYLPFKSFFFQKAAIYAKVRTEKMGDLGVVCTHLSTEIPFPPYLGKFKSWEDEQNHQAMELATWKNADVLMGDMNSGVEKPGLVEFTPEAYNILTEAGFYSPFMEGESAQCTWCGDNPIGGGGESNLAGGGYSDDMILDHIMFRDAEKYSFTSERALYDDYIVTDKKGDHKTKLSDHAGVTVRVFVD